MEMSLDLIGGRKDGFSIMPKVATRWPIFSNIVSTFILLTMHLKGASLLLEKKIQDNLALL